MSTGLKCVLIPVTPFQQNCTLLWCEKTKKAAAVDPGGDLPVIRGAMQEMGVTLEKVLLTHGHVDHALAAGTLAHENGVPIEGPHEDDRFLIDTLQDQGNRYGFPQQEPYLPDRWLKDGDTVTVGEVTLDVFHCPGHTPGHVVFFHKPSRLAIVGDVLFQGSVGRTDFPRGDHAALINSIRTKLWPLGEDVSFIPGHGPISTFGAERRTNPFVADELFSA